MPVSNRTKLFIPVTFFFVMTGLLIYGLTRNPNVVQSALLNHPLPEFSQPGLLPGEGPYTTADLRGQISIVNIWGSWCPPCHVEHPFLLAISEDESDIRFAGISYDYSTDEDREFLAERGSPFDLNIVDADGSLRIDLGVTGAPETFLVDANGIILYRHIGPIDFKVWNQHFVPVLEMLRSTSE